MLTAKQIADEIVSCFENGHKLFAIGNGGSATMSSHLVGELQGKFEIKRKPLPAQTLFDLASMTAIANDYGYKYIFSRPLEALSGPGDILAVLSTSGKSKNCLEATKWAKKHGLVMIDWPRKGKGSAQIQEFQLKLIHDVCRKVEKEMFL